MKRQLARTTSSVNRTTIIPNTIDDAGRNTLNSNRIYWDMRRQNMNRPMGKWLSVVLAQELIKSLNREKISVLEIGCGEGHILNEVSNIRNYACEYRLVGIDKNAEAISSAKKIYPSNSFTVRDLNSNGWDNNLGLFDIVIAVNVLHEVFSHYINNDGSINVSEGKQAVQNVIDTASRLIAKGGYLLIFDGVEYSGNINEIVEIPLPRFKCPVDIDFFAKEYTARQLSLTKSRSSEGQPVKVAMSRMALSKLFAKHKWINTQVWEIERCESYQYYNQEEFIGAVNEAGLDVVHLSLTISDINEWKRYIDLDGLQIEYPFEHILLAATSTNSVEER